MIVGDFRQIVSSDLTNSEVLQLFKPFIKNDTAANDSVDVNLDNLDDKEAK